MVDRNITGSLTPTGGTLSGVALVSDGEPFTPEMAEKLFVDCQTLIEGGKLYGTFTEEWRVPALSVPLRDVAVQFERATLTNGEILLEGKLLQTPRGGALRGWLQTMAAKRSPSGIKFSLVAVGSDARDVIAVRVDILPNWPE